MIIKELWSDNDRRRRDALVDAAESGDLLAGLLAIDETSDDDSVRTEVTAWGAQVEARLARSSPLDAMRHVLVETMSLGGDESEYHARDNSLVGSVVSRRRGMPILLSSLWIIVGRLAGVEVAGVGMPGHFIVRLRDDDEVLVDPFRRGRVMRPSDCRDLVHRLSAGRLPWNDDMLAAVDDTSMLARVLRNLEASCAREGDAEAAYRALRLLAALAPEAADVAWRRADRARDVGAVEEALERCDDVLERFPGSVYAARADRLRSELATSPPPRH